MRVQPFQFRKFFHGGQRFLERGAGVFDDAGAALELVHGQAGNDAPAPPVGSVWLGPAT